MGAGGALRVVEGIGRIMLILSIRVDERGWMSRDYHRRAVVF